MRYRLVLAIALGLAAAAQADSLFTSEVEQGGTLISDKHATFQEGDLITVLVRENIDASTQADTKTKKDASVDASAPPISNPFFIADTGLNLFNAEELPNWDIELENEHKSIGETTRANRLITTISCTVTKVYPNGNIDIKGEKKVTVNREDSTLFIQGTVRSRDVSPGNTVLSTQVANANIELKGKGPLWNNSRRGLLTKIFDWFSPF